MKAELPSAPLPIGGVLDGAFRLYRSTFSHCWFLALFAAVPGFVLVLVQTRVSAELVSAGGATSPLGAATSIYGNPSYLLALIVAAVGTTVAWGCLIVTQKTLAEGKPASFSAAFGAALRGLPAAIAGGFLVVLFVVGGTCLLIIPGIYVMFKLFLFQFAIFADEKGPWTAIQTSWELTRGRWWRGFAIFTVAGVFYYIIVVAVGAVMGAVASFVPVPLESKLTLILALAQLGILLALPFLVSVVLTLYNDSKLRSQGGDLAARAAALG